MLTTSESGLKAKWEFFVLFLQFFSKCELIKNKNKTHVQLPNRCVLRVFILPLTFTFTL